MKPISTTPRSDGYSYIVNSNPCGGYSSDIRVVDVNDCRTLENELNMLRRQNEIMKEALELIGSYTNEDYQGRIHTSPEGCIAHEALNQLQFFTP